MSIRLRVIGAFLALIVIITALELYDRKIIAQISGDAVMINLAGTQRYRTAKLAYLSRRYIEKKSADDLRILISDLERYEKVLQGLSQGSKELGLKGTTNPKILETLQETAPMWERYKRQIAFVTMTSEISANERLMALNEVDAMALPLLEKMDVVTFALDRETTAAVEQFKKVKLYSIIMLITAGLFLVVEIIRAFVKPMNRLMKALDRAAEGDLESKFVAGGDNEFAKVADSFNHMTDNLRRSRRELEKVKNELEDFVYTVSHDLKEPLRSIASFSHFIAEDYHDKLDDEGKDYINRIIKSSTRMRELIDDLLTLSRVGRIQNPYQEVRASEIIEEVTTSLHQAITEKSAEINVKEGLPVIYCDKILMREVFLNLIANALKFCDKDHPIIEIGYSDSPHEHCFYVKDNGIGIEERYFEKIFEVFERLNRREEYEGTGAGLTIVKKIIEEHHGRVWLESKIGAGTTFYFTLPKEQ